jgi:hypothetical protein
MGGGVVLVWVVALSLDDQDKFLRGIWRGSEKDRRDVHASVKWKKNFVFKQFPAIYVTSYISFPKNFVYRASKNIC